MSVVSPYVGVGLPKDKLPGIKNMSVDDIINLVCEYFKINRTFFFNKSRHNLQVRARYIAAYLIRIYLYKTYTEMTQYFGKTMTDHTSVRHGVVAIKDQLSLKHDNETKHDVENILELANNRIPKPLTQTIK